MPEKPHEHYRCTSSGKYQEIKKGLEDQGFKYIGNSIVDNALYEQMCNAKEATKFKNAVQERVQSLIDKGCIVRTTNYFTEGFSLDGLVAFFTKKLKK